MKNSLNEGHAVLVGRDGQEIEEECGRRLALEIDDVGGVEMGAGDGEGRRVDRQGYRRN